MPITTNPLTELNNKRRFIFAHNSANFYIRIITEPTIMQDRHDCSELLRKMLNMLECQNQPLEQAWITGYEERIISTNRCANENYTYFILENEEGRAIGILSGDIYPNNCSDTIKDAIGINAKNLFIESEYRNAGFAQMLLSKVFTVIPKMVGEITIMMTGLSKESLSAHNLERYRKYAVKAGLSSDVEGKPNGNGIYFMVKPRCTYQEAKDISLGFRREVADKHLLDISKTPERQGWRYTP